MCNWKCQLSFQGQWKYLGPCLPYCLSRETQLCMGGSSFILLPSGGHLQPKLALRCFHSRVRQGHRSDYCPAISAMPMGRKRRVGRAAQLALADSHQGFLRPLVPTPFPPQQGWLFPLLILGRHILLQREESRDQQQSKGWASRGGPACPLQQFPLPAGELGNHARDIFMSPHACFY